MANQFGGMVDLVHPAIYDWGMTKKSRPPTFTEFYVLFGLASQLQQNLDRHLDEQGLVSVNDLRALYFIASNSDPAGAAEEATTHRLGCELGLPAGTAKGLVRRLESRGLVVALKPGTYGGGNRKSLRLTKSGEESLRKGMVGWPYAVNRTARVLDAQGMEALGRALGRLHGAPQRLRQLFDLEGTKEATYHGID